MFVMMTFDIGGGSKGWDDFSYRQGDLETPCDRDPGGQKERVNPYADRGLHAIVFVKRGVGIIRKKLLQTCRPA